MADTKFWMVYVEGTLGASYKHYTKAAVVKEAERLATELPDRKVFVLETQAYCIKSTVQWVRCSQLKAA